MLRLAFNNFGSYYFTYEPSGPDRQILERACFLEIERTGAGMVHMGVHRLHPMLLRVWQELGLRGVQEKCPNQLDTYKKLLDREFGVYGNVTINPATKELTIEIEKRSTDQWQWRWLKEEKLRKKDSGPVGDFEI